MTTAAGARASTRSRPRGGKAPLEEAKSELAEQGLADRIPQIQGIPEMREAADRAEGRRRLEGLIS